MQKIKVIIILLFIIFITACTSTTKLDDIINSNNYIIVDVRTPEEYNESHIVDAINIPYDLIDENIDLNKNKTILVYCKSGKRSSLAYEVLTTLGYKVYDLGAYDNITKFNKE